MQIKKITTIFSSLVLVDFFVNSECYLSKVTPDVQENKNYLPNSINTDNEKEIDKPHLSIVHNNLHDGVIKFSDNVLTTIINKLPEDIFTYVFLKYIVQADMDEVMSFREDFKKYPSKKFMLTKIPEGEESKNKTGDFKHYLNLASSFFSSFKYIFTLVIAAGGSYVLMIFYHYKKNPVNLEEQLLQELEGSNILLHSGDHNTDNTPLSGLVGNFSQLHQNVSAIDNSENRVDQRTSSTSTGTYSLAEKFTPRTGTYSLVEEFTPRRRENNLSPESPAMVINSC